MKLQTDLQKEYNDILIKRDRLVSMADKEIESLGLKLLSFTNQLNKTVPKDEIYHRRLHNLRTTALRMSKMSETNRLERIEYVGWLNYLLNHYFKNVEEMLHLIHN